MIRFTVLVPASLAPIPFKLSFAALGDESGGGDVRRGTATFR